MRRDLRFWIFNRGGGTSGRSCTAGSWARAAYRIEFRRGTFGFVMARARRAPAGGLASALSGWLPVTQSTPLSPGFTAREIRRLWRMPSKRVILPTPFCLRHVAEEMSGIESAVPPDGASQGILA